MHRDAIYTVQGKSDDQRLNSAHLAFKLKLGGGDHETISVTYFPPRACPKSKRDFLNRINEDAATRLYNFRLCGRSLLLI